MNPPATQSFTISVTEPITLPAGVVAYWPLDEASGPVYADVTGTNDGTGNLSPTAVTGQVNGGQQFDGSTTKIEVPASPTFDFAADGDFSVEFWYKGTSAPASTQCCYRQIYSQAYWYVGIINSGKITILHE